MDRLAVQAVPLTADEVRQSADLYRLVVESAPVHAIVLLDPGGNIVSWNKAAERIFGHAGDEVIGRPHALLYASNNAGLDASQHALRRALADGWHDEEAQCLRKSGEPFRAYVSVATLRDDDGRHLGFFKVLRDVTEHKASDEALLRSIVDTALEGVITVNDRGEIETFNRAAEKIFGYEAAEVVGRNATMLLPESQRSEIDEYVAEILRAGNVKLAGVGRELAGLRRDGTIFPMEIAVSEFTAWGKRHFTGLIRDVSERADLQERLLRSQKMDVVGKLAGGIAHDFNNLLTVISGYAELLLGTMPAGDPQRTSIEAIKEAGARAAELTRRLLAFSSQAISVPKVLDLNVIVAETEELLRRMIGEDIMLTTVLDATIRPVRVDPAQIGQVLMNLAVNSRDAMPQGGRLTIETDSVELDADYAAAHPDATPGRYVLLSVSDTGCGMTREVRRRIFEPFFTTKGVGKGTGLGLATVYGIARQNGGHVEVYSEVGRGTTFRVYLPVADDAASAVADRPAADAHPRGHETVLLVEDDESVRQIALLILRGQGYDVLEACDGRSAMDLARRYEGKIDLLITDVIMPEISGRQVAEELAADRPSMKVLFVSGYTDDAVVRHGILRADVDFLQKPYTPQTLSRKVRSVLDDE